MNTYSGDDLLRTVPLLAVADMAESIDFYVGKLGFAIKQKWVEDGKLRWGWLQRGGAALMLQEFHQHGHDAWKPEGIVGEGVSIYLICGDAVSIYHELSKRGVQVSVPFVGNGMWVIGITDPDGYKLYFESETNVAEGTIYSDKL